MPGEAPAERARKAALEHAPAGIDSDVAEYLSQTAAQLAEDEDVDSAGFREELEAAAGPILEDLDLNAADVAAFCSKVVDAAYPSGDLAAAAAPGSAKAGASGAGVAAEDSGGGELMVCVPSFLLMYGGSPVPLLKNARLELRLGRRYGVVGANGTGKTTLMSRLAKKDIAGFPPDVRVVHLRHEQILKGIDLSTPAREYARLRSFEADGQQQVETADLAAALRDVGFDEELLGRSVGALSGGWQMRLALACAIAQKARLLILDEPTNHLDAAAVAWLASFINSTCVLGESGSTALVVSHDADFLNQICTDIIHFTPDGKLVYHPGDFDSFKLKELKGDEAKAQQLLEVDAQQVDEGAEAALAEPIGLGSNEKLVFPAPERISGIGMTAGSGGLGKGPPVVLRLRCTEFQHTGAQAPTLHDVNLEMTPSSRVGIVGKNGSGKSTLLSLLAARTPVKAGFGDLWLHDSLRLVYIAQHHESQLADFLGCTPAEYIQLRFKRGYDAETPRRDLAHVPKGKEAVRIKDLAKRYGKRGHGVEMLVSRHHNGEECLYEVKWMDLGPTENTFEKMSRLKGLGVEWMATAFDSLLAAAWGDGPLRPLTQREVARHLEDFGLSEEVACKRQISMLSSGQKTKMMLAASFWTRPHLICLDEPTNYLDAETLEALQRALKNFKGAFAIVSHHEKFLDDVCDELWEVCDGRVSRRERPRG